MVVLLSAEEMKGGLIGLRLSYNSASPLPTIVKFVHVGTENKTAYGNGESREIRTFRWGERDYKLVGTADLLPTIICVSCSTISVFNQ
jgi:hypothetical protein